VFYAEFPDDDLEADAHADRITEEITSLVETLPYVLDGSVSIDYLDTEPEPS
jgi:hypothetical protein